MLFFIKPNIPSKNKRNLTENDIHLQDLIGALEHDPDDVKQATAVAIGKIARGNPSAFVEQIENWIFKASKVTIYMTIALREIVCKQSIWEINGEFNRILWNCLSAVSKAENEAALIIAAECLSARTQQVPEEGFARIEV